MTEEMINTEEIMNQIRENIKTRGYSDLDLSFDDVTAGNYDKYEKPEFSLSEMSSEVSYADSSKCVDYLQPMDGGGVKLAIKKIIRKFCKPAVAPLVESQNLFNGATARALAQMDAYITEREGGDGGKRKADEKEFMDVQEKLTEDLDTRVILLEQKIEQLEKKISELEAKE